MARSNTRAGTPKATVIIVTYNSANWIKPCLDAILRQDYAPGFEVVVVDNGSVDKTSQIIKRNYPQVRLVQSTNRGFGAGNNLGVQEAKTELVAFANPDTVAEPGWLNALLEPLSQKATITTSQVLLVSEPTKINTIGLDLHFMGFSFVRGYQQEAIDAEPGDVPGLSGAAFAMNRSDYRRLNGFDETIFLYGEDAELSWRAQQAGFRILGVPASRIRHNYRLRLDAPKLFQLERTRQWMLRKHLTPWQRIAYAPSRLLARLLVNAYARRFGSAGKDAVQRARQEARELERPKPQRNRLGTYTRNTIPFTTAFPESRTARFFGFFPNLAFRVFGPWSRRRRRWLHVPR